MFVMFMVTTPLFANDIYVTQSGASLELNIKQDGQDNKVGNSTTASTVTGATSDIDIDQIGENISILNVTEYSTGQAPQSDEHELQSSSLSQAPSPQTSPPTAPRSAGSRLASLRRNRCLVLDTPSLHMFPLEYLPLKGGDR